MPAPHGRARHTIFNGERWGVIYARPRRTVRQGIERQPDRAPPPLRPLSERHLAVLAEVRRQGGRGAIRVARATGLPVTFVNSAINVLAKRGLVSHRPAGGWVANDERSSDT